MLVFILTRHEPGGLEWPRVREARWLRRSRDPETGRVGGRVWWVLPFVVPFALEEVLSIPGPSVRDFGDFRDSDRGEDFFRGASGWFAVVVPAVFNTVLGDELLLRGLLLPRMQGVFGKRDWVAKEEDLLRRFIEGESIRSGDGHQALKRAVERTRERN